MTSHPIPARGETTPDTRPVRDGLDDSPILPFPPGFDPATRLPVEPAEPFDTTHCDDGCARHDSLDPSTVLWKAILHSPTCQQRQHIARLTSEVSALREAVDADKARLDWLDARDSFDFEDFVTAWHQGVSVREAIDIARRDGAP